MLILHELMSCPVAKRKRADRFPAVFSAVVTPLNVRMLKSYRPIRKYFCKSFG